MFYRELAERFNEFDVMKKIMDDTEFTDTPLKGIKSMSFLNFEYQRIQTAAYKAKPIFGSHFDKYLFCQMTSVNYLTIKVNEKIKNMESSLCLTENDKYLLCYYYELRRRYINLAYFYIKINSSLSR